LIRRRRRPPKLGLQTAFWTTPRRQLKLRAELSNSQFKPAAIGGLVGSAGQVQPHRAYLHRKVLEDQNALLSRCVYSRRGDRQPELGILGVNLWGNEPLLVCVLRISVSDINQRNGDKPASWIGECWGVSHGPVAPSIHRP
jgi:hypothetical protein